MHTKVINFATYSSLKIGTPIRVNVISTPKEAIYAFSKHMYVIGKANNMLIAPSANNIAILDKQFSYIIEQDRYIEIGGALASNTIFRYFKANNLRGVEFLQALPGSLGGLVKMNAGMKDYEIAQSLIEINVNNIWHKASSFPMMYRNSGIEGIILAARFYKIHGFRHDVWTKCNALRKYHPKEPSCGSCFKNPQGDYAGRLLESVGLKGYGIGDAAFSDKHANFLINKGSATFDNAIALIDLAKNRVFESSGIMLECEVQILY